MRYLLILPLILGACAQAAPVNAPDVVVTTCDPSDYAAFIGEGEEIFARSTFPEPMRIIRPNQPVTMDFIVDRLNFQLDNTGTIVRVYCG